jgi:hypothetical protein
MNNIKIAVDIDGCLIYAEGMTGTPDTPRYDVIMLIAWLAEIFNCEVYIWSGGGIDYATRWRDKLGLDFAQVITKGSIQPDIAIDDEEVTLGKVNLKV